MKLIKNKRLLDLSRIIVGPYASMVLSDFGVEVIKVQSEQGDPTRTWGPPWHQGTSTYFQSINRSKKSIMLNLKKDSHRDVLCKLVESSDAVLENFIPGVTEKLKIDYNTLKKVNKQLVYCSISGYGDIGGMKHSPAFDNIIQAEAGFMHLTGIQDGPPFKLGFAITDVITALYASNAVLAGLLHREQTGEGIHLRTSLYECAVSALINQGSNYLNGNLNPNRMGNHHPNIVPYGLYETKDSPIIICVGTAQQYERLIKCLQMPNEQKFNTNSQRVENRRQFDELLNSYLRKISSQQAIQLLRRNNVPCGRVNNLQQCFESQLCKELELVREVDGVGYVRSPINESTAEKLTITPPPKHNQHAHELLTELGYSKQMIHSLYEEK